MLLINLPTFVHTRNPDDVSGTFGTNAYQLVYLLLVLVTLVVGIATFEPGTRVARFAIPLLAGFSVVMLLAQYRALLASTVVALFAVAYMLKGRGRGVLAVGAAVARFRGRLLLRRDAIVVPEAGRGRHEHCRIADGLREGRAGVVGHVLDMYADIPATVAIGSGPGTYSSRAWQTFAKADSTSRTNVVGGYATSLTGGSVYSTDVSEKYVDAADRGRADRAGLSSDLESVLELRVAHGRGRAARRRAHRDVATSAHSRACGGWRAD